MKFRNQRNNIIKNYSFIDPQLIKYRYNQHFGLLFQQYKRLGQKFHMGLPSWE